MILVPQIPILDQFRRYLPSRFAVLPELVLKPVELCVELNSASGDVIFNFGYRAKNGTCTPNTHSRDHFKRYFLSGFAVLSELVLTQVELYAELNSASNGTIY